MGPSVQQLLIVLAIVILIFGAKKIPELAKGLGSGIKNFKKAVKEDEEPESTAQSAQPQQPQMLNTQAAPQNAAQNVAQPAPQNVVQPQNINPAPAQPQSTQPQG